MKLTERQQLTTTPTEDLQKQLADAERHLLEDRFNAGLNRLTNPAGMHHTRKQIARLKTLLRQRELLAEHGFSTMDEYKAYRVAERRAYRETHRS